MSGKYTYKVDIKAKLDSKDLEAKLKQLTKPRTINIKVNAQGLTQLQNTLNKLQTTTKGVSSSFDKLGSSKGLKTVTDTTDNLVKSNKQYNKSLDETYRKTKKITSNSFDKDQWQTSVSKTKQSMGLSGSTTVVNGATSSRSFTQSLRDTGIINGVGTGSSRNTQIKTRNVVVEPSSSTSIGGAKASSVGVYNSRRGSTSGQYSAIRTSGYSLSQMSKKYDIMSSAMFGLTSMLGATSLKSTLIDTPAKAEVNKVLIQGMGDSTVSGTELYNAVDEKTNNSLVSMQDVIQPLKAFQASSGASAAEIKEIIPNFVDYGEYVQAMTGSTELATTAMQKLSYAIQGRYAAEDQYGISEEALARTGMWNGDEKDVVGFMNAVKEVIGDNSGLMDTFTGQEQKVEKQFRVAGKKIWEGGLGSISKGLVTGFADLNSSLDFLPSKLALVAAALGTLATGAIGFIGYGGQLVSSMAEGMGDIAKLRKNGGILKNVKYMMSDAFALMRGKELDYDENGNIIHTVDNRSRKQKIKDKVGSASKNRRLRAMGIFEDMMGSTYVNPNISRTTRGRIGTIKRTQGLSGVGRYGIKNVTSELKSFGKGLTGAISSFGLFNAALLVAIPLITGLSLLHTVMSKQSQAYNDAIQNVKNRLGVTGETIIGGIGNLFGSLGWTDNEGIEAAADGFVVILNTLGGAIEDVNGIISSVTGYYPEKNKLKKQAEEEAKSSDPQTKKHGEDVLEYINSGKWDRVNAGLDEDSNASVFVKKLGDGWFDLGNWINQGLGLYDQSGADAVKQKWTDMMNNQGTNQVDPNTTGKNFDFGEWLGIFEDGKFKLESVTGVCDSIAEIFNNALETLQSIPIIGDFFKNNDSVQNSNQSSTTMTYNTNNGAGSNIGSQGGTNGTTDPVANNNSTWQQILSDTWAKVTQNSNNIVNGTQQGANQVPTTLNNNAPAAFSAGTNLGNNSTMGLSTGLAGMGATGSAGAATGVAGINSQTGASGQAGSNMGNSANQGFNVLNLSSIAGSEAGSAVQAFLSRVGEMYSAAFSLGQAGAEGYQDGADTHSPGIAARSAFAEVGWIVDSFKQGASQGYNNAKLLGSSTANGFMKGYPSNLLNDNLDMGSSYGGYMSSAPNYGGSSNNTTNNSNNGRNIVNNFNIEKIDSKDRIREIGETIVKMVTWDNETAGRNTTDPFTT